ncbi:MAG: hypothetical protein ACFFDO_01210 [Candidatus Thorarchaeota archaeon]
MYDKEDQYFYNENERIIDRQLKYFYLMDKEKKFSNENLYIKAYYLHHLLDYFTETRIDINNIELVFKKFLEDKVIVELSDSGKTINFRKEIKEIFQLLRENKQDLYDDLKGLHLIS